MLNNTKYPIWFTALLVIFFSTSAFGQKPNKLQTVEKNHKAIRGFNQKWIVLPQFSEALFQNIKSLKPEIIRYPGGTVTHKFNWKTGTTTTNHPNDEVHLIGDVRKLVDHAGVKIMFNLDIVNSTVQDQIAMLKASKVEVLYLELGNEIYLKDTPKGNDNRRLAAKFPDGFAYADSVNKWVPFLRKEFPKAKIAACLIGKTANGSNIRQATWNSSVTSGVKDIDAYTYHLYIPVGSNFETQKASFESAKVSTPGKETWVTEYGNLNPYTNVKSYLAELNKLAEYIESFADISLNHTLVTKSKDDGEQHSKLTALSNGASFTAEGKLFLERVK